ncbi:Protein G12 [Camponotus floridanus]|uniref:Protein G12 n=2 Tax=Camponotus floridanus TaxID=104421 RepID=E2A6E2_CAMFO|nr:Protein G12 [Camponotus floridanus]
MKFTLTLSAILVIIGLGQAHQFANFGKGPLHEDFQDFLDLLPLEKISNIVEDYWNNDPELKAAIEYVFTSGLLKDFYTEYEAIPQVIEYFNYLQKEGIDIYSAINEINKILDIKELVPPRMSYTNSTIQKRTGGIAGYYKDLFATLPLDKIIHLYAQKLKTSLAFVRYINEIKSNNYQQIVNKVYEIKSFKIMNNGLKSKGVNTEISEDIMYIVFGLNVPSN